MKNRVLGSTALALAASLALAGCQTSGGTTITAAQVESDLSTFASAVQAAAVAACGVEPTVASVSALLTSGNAVASAANTTATAVAGLICKAAVATAPAAVAHRFRATGRYRVPAPVTIGGVVVQFEPPKI